MKEKKLVYEEPELDVLYFVNKDVVTLSGGESGSMEEEDFEDIMGQWL